MKGVRGRMNPAKQGDYDGACGFYSIGNAISLIYPEVDPDIIFVQVFKQFIKCCKNHSIIKGMMRGKLNEVLINTTAKLEKEGVRLEVYRPYWTCEASSLRDYKEFLLDTVGSKKDTVAIIGYEHCQHDPETDYWSHWTVAKSITKSNIITFDSSEERKRIPFSRCRIWDNKARHISKPYKLSTSDTFIISKSE
jgi:hypothetical protein